MPKPLRQADWGQRGGGWVSWAAGWGPVGQLGGEGRTPAGVPLLPYTLVSEDTRGSDLPLPKGASIFGGGQQAAVLGARGLGVPPGAHLPTISPRQDLLSPSSVTSHPPPPLQGPRRPLSPDRGQLWPLVAFNLSGRGQLGRPAVSLTRPVWMGLGGWVSLGSRGE